MEKSKNEIDSELKEMLGVLNAIRIPLLHILSIDEIYLNEGEISSLRPNQKQHLYAILKSFEISIQEVTKSPRVRDVNKMNTFLRLAKNESCKYFQSFVQDGLFPEVG